MYCKFLCAARKAGLEPGEQLPELPGESPAVSIYGNRTMPSGWRVVA